MYQDRKPSKTHGPKHGRTKAGPNPTGKTRSDIQTTPGSAGTNAPESMRSTAKVYMKKCASIFTRTGVLHGRPKKS